MKIKKLLLNSLIFFLPFIIIFFILFCFNILTKDFSFGHKSHNVYPQAMNWTQYSFALNKKKITNFLFKLSNNEKGLPRVEIYVPEKTSNKLLSNVPYSTKQYLKAEMLINKKKKKIRIRYFGDNPANWMFEHKAIRIKTKKSNLVNRKRFFEYRPSQNSVIDEFVAFKIAKKLNLLVSDVRLVELFINDKSVGIYMEKEKLNESFLRRNKIMPINLYKGEASRNSEKKIGLEFNLDQNPGLWEKISFLNTRNLNDYEDLIKFTNYIRKAESSINELDQIFKFENIDLLARTSVLEILLNTEISEFTHNRRMAIDVWSGKTHMIPHDFFYIRSKINEENFRLDKSSSYLFDVINQSSKFLDIKYDTLYKVVKKEKIFDEIIKDIENLKEKYLISQRTDLGETYRKYVHWRNYEGPENKKSFDELIKSLRNREQKIINFLERDPKGSWKINKKSFDVKIKKSIPISNLLVKFSGKSPKWIVLDSNNNQVIDKEDNYFFPNINGNFKINVKLFANRIPVNTSLLTTRNQIVTGNTKFTFFVENYLKPSELITFNKYTKKKLFLELNESKATGPSLHNIAIIENNKKKTNLLSGNIFLEKDLIIKSETKILEGTIFTMSEGASIVFENKVKAVGSNEKPIIFKKHDEAKNWGTIALHGAKTDGSIFKNIIIENASGKSINGIDYFSSLSVHAAKNIIFDNILIKNNSNFDDMMHIIYSDNIQVINSNFLNAYKDSIDVDVSKDILFVNSNVLNSGNDGIDFMESTAQLYKMNISSSADKGVSVGENSRVLINDSIISSNNYGVVSKDLSKTIIKNTLLENNKIQLSVYKKNWRYGGSGVIQIKNSEISAVENYINSDEMGKISISSSNIIGIIKKNQNVKIN
tara:strand:- start:1379 stop:4015 length:2637 start_codon:yes stop_codon:yes gene_type:complete